MKQFSPLSTREMEVSELLVFGSTCKDVANSLFLSVDTIITHKKNIYRKLAIRKETELSKWYFSRRFGFKIDLKPLFKILSAAFLLATLALGQLSADDSDMLRARRSSRSRVSRTSRTKRKD